MLKFEEKESMKIGELAGELDRTVLTIKRWEESKLIPKAKRNSHGQRYYTLKDVNKIRNFAKAWQEQKERRWGIRE